MHVARSAGMDDSAATGGGERWPSWRRNVVIGIGVGIAHLAMAFLVLVWHSQPGFAVFWPSAGLAAGALLAFGRSAWPTLTISGVIAVALANVLVGRPAGHAVVFGLCDMIESLTVAYLTGRFTGRSGCFDRLSHLGGFVVAAMLGTAFAGLSAALLFKLLLGTREGFWLLFELWYEATFVGVCTFAPVVIMLPSLIREPPSLPTIVEGGLVLAVLGAVAVYVYGGFMPETGALRFFASGSTFLIPLILWIAARAPTAFAGAAVAIVATVIVYCTSNGLGRLGDPALPLDDRALAARISMLTFAAVALCIAALFSERRRAEASLRVANRELSELSATLEARVAERTRDLSVANGELTRQGVERERVNAVLRQSEGWHRAAQRVAGLGSFSLGHTPAAGQHWSDEAQRILGHGAPDATIDGFVDGIVHATDRGRVREALTRAAADRAATSLEYRIVRGDGSERTVLTAVEPETDADGATKLLCTALDVTERNAVEHKLAEYRAELLHVVRVATVGELASITAHEVNQPLAAISHTASALIRLHASGRLPPAELSEHLAEIAAQAQRASGIIRQIRQFVQKRTTASRPLDMDAVIRDVIRLVGPYARRNGVQLEYVAHGGLPPVAGEEVQVGQVLVNLVRNAIEAAAMSEAPQHRVVVSTATAGSGVVVEVRDSGPGIPQQVGAQIFEPFFTTKPDGLGMGLPIARTIVEAHGGHLELAGSSEGAVFRATFPALRTHGEAAAPPAQRMPETTAA